jgi:hypothetical protein
MTKQLVFLKFFKGIQYLKMMMTKHLVFFKTSNNALSEAEEEDVQRMEGTTGWVQKGRGEKSTSGPDGYRGG